MTQPILVPLDGSELAEQALDLAVAVATRTAAPIHLVRMPLWPPNSPLAARDDVTSYLDAAAERVSAQVDAKVETAILPEKAQDGDSWPASAGSIADHVLEYGRKRGAAMVVLATHGRGGLARAWFGSVADALIRRADLPVLVVRPEEGEPSDRAIRHVLVPLDPSDASRSVLEPATSLARAFDARITLLRIIPWPYQVNDTFLPATVVSVGEDLATVRANAAQELEGVAASLRTQGLEVEVAVMEHVAPGRAIADYAKDEGADLVALATHSRSGFDRLVLGSVADKVVRGAECPVLLVRSGD